jgi:hypothetical protein
MGLDRFTRKLTKWALILQEYDFDILHRVGRVNWDVDGLSQNSCSSEEDTTCARWHGEVDLKVVLKWCAFVDINILLGCFGDVPHTTRVMGIPIVMMMSQRAMVPWTSI